MKTLILSPRWSGPATSFRHTWERFVNVDQHRWLVRQDLLEQLSCVRRELGGRVIRAVGMFDDELRVLCPGPETVGAPDPRPARTNWQMLDSIWDELLGRGLTPMFTTSFIPSRMASGPTRVFTTQGHTSPPRDLGEWSRFVEEAVRHASDRYGAEAVRQWPFEVWNEPNLHGWFWGGSQADFFKFWTATFRAIKRVDPSYRVGGPSTARAEWIEEFLAHAGREECMPDYLTLHIYNNDGAAAALAPFAGLQHSQTGTSPDLALGVIHGARRLADRLGFSGEIHFNEWGSSWRGFEPARETANEAAFVVRTMAEGSQAADEFAYWCVSDIYDQVGFGRETFHGNYGLMSLQGLRKPAYHAFHLLHRLSAERIDANIEGAGLFEGAVVTRSTDRAQVLVYSYRHESDPDPESRVVRVELPGDADGAPSLHRIDSTENNVVARWQSLGSPAYLSRPQLEDLRAVDELRESSSTVAVLRSETGFTAEFTMECPGVALLTLPIRA